MKAIINAALILESAILDDACVLMENGLITAVGPMEAFPSLDCETIDAGGLYAGPGFVDIHCHAGGDVWAYEDPVRMAAHHLTHGTTSLNCTIYHDIGEEGAIEAMRRIRAAMQAGTPGNIIGVHFEGPFLNPKYGAMAATIRPVDKREYSRYLAEFADIITLWTVAPEMPGARAFIKDAAETGINVALGHSEAAYADVAWAAENGARVCTHLMDATGCPPTRWAGTREVGFDEAVLLQDKLFCEIINDKEGVHVRPEMIRLIIKAAGLDRIVGITDACTGAPGDTDINLLNGELYGSKLTMQGVARNFAKNAGLGIADIFKVCARNPARALRKDAEIGSIAPGKKANLLIVDADFTIRQVLLEGNTLPI
jgi:N-acetylglucosamine-6-phosphate deacetylase